MAHLEYIDNSGNESVLKLVDGMTISIGRNPGSAIYTSNPSVSRSHSRIAQENDQWFIKDLGSSNGTYVNDSEERISEYVLTSSDRVRCGDFVITFINDDTVPSDALAAAKPDPFLSIEDDLNSSVVETAQKEKRTMRPRTIPTSSDMQFVKKHERTKLRQSAVRTRKKSGSRKRSAKDEQAKLQQATSEREEQLVNQIQEQAAEIEAAAADLKEYSSLVEDLEIKIEELDTKTTRYELELDSITEKYVEIKDQLTVQKERLEEAREDVADRDDRIYQQENQIRDLESELEDAREKASGSVEVVSELKIKATQKDRQLEEIQRQLDLMEFEFRATKEELQALQDEHNTGAGDTQKLERKVNQLREIITDKENVISELRLDVENKDIEIRQVRMGMGMTDLEDEKRKLLQDYYDKNREVDQLRDELNALQHENTEMSARLVEVEAAVEKKPAPVTVADITTHPEFKAKVRETKRLEKRTKELQDELNSAQEQLEEFSSDDRQRLEKELKSLKRKTTSLTNKLNDAKTQLSELKSSPQPSGEQLEDVRTEVQLAALRVSLTEQLDGVSESFSQFKGNFSLFRNYLKDLSDFVTAIKTNEDLSDEISQALEDTNPAEAMDSVGDLLRVVNSDAKALKQGLQKIKASIEE